MHTHGGSGVEGPKVHGHESSPVRHTRHAKGRQATLPGLICKRGCAGRVVVGGVMPRVEGAADGSPLPS